MPRGIVCWCEFDRNLLYIALIATGEDAEEAIAEAKEEKKKIKVELV
jgi:hypothetical protein